jgi:hypothetical protein
MDFSRWYEARCADYGNAGQPLPHIDFLKGLYADECREAEPKQQERNRVRQLEAEVVSLDNCLHQVALAISNLIDRIEQLEKRPTLKYCGVWSADHRYVRGELVTHSGSMWYCNEPTNTKPPGSHWTLCVKAGRNGRDLTKVDDKANDR